MTTSSVDTPQPSANSGMRFDELYRLKGVVRIFLFHIVDHRLPSSHTVPPNVVSSEPVHSQQFEKDFIGPIANTPTQ
jgi:hypothetical protein